MRKIIAQSDYDGGDDDDDDGHHNGHIIIMVFATPFNRYLIK